MPLLNDKCGNCHTNVVGLEKDMTLLKYSPASYAEKCSEETRTREVDHGEMVETVSEKRSIARCPVCGRKAALEWYTTGVEKEWKDGGCEQ